MSAPAIVWIAVGVVTAAALVALVIGLVRHVLVLVKALTEFQEQVQPLAEDISAQSQRASDRTARMQSRGRSRS